MATNAPSGDGHRNGAVRKRSQIQNTSDKSFTKRDAESGKFVDHKGPSKKYKGVRTEKE